MRVIRRILVAVKDPGARSLPSVAKAVQLAGALGAQIELFHALDVPLYVDTSGRDSLRDRTKKQKAQCLKQLEWLATRLRKRGVEATVAAEWDFPAHEAIVRRATRAGADLVIAECRARHRTTTWLLRLTDWELLRHSPVPVLLVKNARPYRQPVVLAAIDPGHAHAKTSKLDDEILGMGAAIQEAMHGSLHAVHAYLPAIPVPAYQTITPEISTRWLAEVAETAARQFDRALRKTDIPRARRHLIAAPPQTAIETVARQTRSAIVVMGAVSRSGLGRIFIGDTAERVLDKLSCDVLVVRPPQFATRVPRATRGVHMVVPPPAWPF